MNGMLLNSFKTPTQIFDEEGLLFYPQLFSPREIERLRVACDYVLDQFREELQQTAPDGAGRAISLRQLHDSRWHGATPEHFRVLMETIADPRCLGPVEQIYQGRSLFRATSLFYNPLCDNTEGDWHRDQQFMFKSEDEVCDYYNTPRDIRTDRQNAIQIQIALVESEDIEYVPFSARRYDSPQEYFLRCADERSHNRESGMPNAMRIHQKPGDAIIFNPAGLHRGRYYADSPRRTLLLTYTAQDTKIHDTFSRQPWMLEPSYLDGISPRARVYFEEFIEAYRYSWTQ